MAAENGLDLSAFIVEKGTEAEEGNTEEVAEISLSPDLEAEEARKEELREQARKVRNNVKVMKKILWRVMRYKLMYMLTCCSLHDFLIFNMVCQLMDCRTAVIEIMIKLFQPFKMLIKRPEN